MKQNNEDIIEDAVYGEEAAPENTEAQIEDVAPESADEGEEMSEIESLKALLQQRDESLEKEKKEYMFLMADFDNFKKRTLREKAELLKNGGETALRGLLPILDDFERGIEAMKDTTDAASIKDGVVLIYNKFVKYLEQNGVKAIESNGADFNDELHEAIALVPVQDESQKGKVIDTMTKGYTLNGKVIRHAKVAVGQ